MDFDDFDDFEDRGDYDDFDEDSFYNDDFDTDLEDTSEEEGPADPVTGRNGLEWYEMAFLGGLADQLSEEKKQRRRIKTDRNHPKRKS